MKKIISLLGFGLILCLGSAASVRAEGFRLRWVETDVTLDRDGKARVAYTVQWSADGGTLHGFYFEGFQEAPNFDPGSAYALDDRGRRYALSIAKLHDTKYDIVLADGQAFTDGTITYFFRYDTDLQASGNVTQTRAPQGLLAVFNWAPVQWDDPLDHETVTVHFPVLLEQAEAGPTAAGRLKFMTEKYVNERYSIDYPTVTNSEGEPVFTVRFHRKNLDSRYHFQIQAYLDAALFSLTSIATRTPLEDTGGLQRAPEPNFLNRSFPGGALGSLPLSVSQAAVIALAGIAIFVLLPLYLMTRKQRSMLAAREGLSAVSWDGDEWVPPKIQLGTFRQKGKISTDLTPLEAALLLEMPFATLVGLMARNLERKGVVKIVGTDPLALRRQEGAASTDPYETLLLNAILPDGTLAAPGLRSVFQGLAAGLEQKTWDCDLDATREHYRNRQEPVRATLGTHSDWPYYWAGYHAWSRPGGYDANYAPAAQVSQQVEKLTPELAQGITGIKSSSVCYDGPFVRDVCHDACHSACHDACHSACHSACHGACHGACVSSGH